MHFISNRTDHFYRRWLSLFFMLGLMMSPMLLDFLSGLLLLLFCFLIFVLILALLSLTLLLWNILVDRMDILLFLLVLHESYHLTNNYLSLTWLAFNRLELSLCDKSCHLLCTRHLQKLELRKWGLLFYIHWALGSFVWNSLLAEAFRHKYQEISQKNPCVKGGQK